MLIATFHSGSTDVHGRLKPEQRHFRHADIRNERHGTPAFLWPSCRQILVLTADLWQSKKAPDFKLAFMRRLGKRFLDFARLSHDLVALPEHHHAQTDDKHAQKPERLAARLSSLSISKASFAVICGVSERTVANWVSGRTRINPAALAYLEQIEANAELRRTLGIGEKAKGAPRGRPFAKGNPYRFGDRRQPVWVAGAQMARAVA
jgi:DNA-binding transcriptional regulator YiaG